MPKARRLVWITLCACTAVLTSLLLPVSTNAGETLERVPVLDQAGRPRADHTILNTIIRLE